MWICGAPCPARITSFLSILFSRKLTEEKSPYEQRHPPSDISLAVVSVSSSRKSSVAVSLAHRRLEGGVEGPGLLLQREMQLLSSLLLWPRGACGCHPGFILRKKSRLKGNKKGPFRKAAYSEVYRETHALRPPYPW